MLSITYLMGAFGFRLAQLQLVQGNYYRSRAEVNRIRQVPIPPQRGDILDREGRRLATHRLSRAVYLWPREYTQAQWQVKAVQLSPILDLPADEILAKLAQTGYNSPLPVRVSRDIGQEGYLALSEIDFRGVEMRAESNRYYPHDRVASHVLGYISEASLAELKAHREYPMGAMVGRMGVEKLANDRLSGVWGKRILEVNAQGSEFGELGIRPPRPGNSVQLTLDLDLQTAAQTALKGRRGGVVALNVKTGEVLALASGPTFDPNMFTRRITSAEWQHLQSQEQPFLNRALQGYPPGSTFKIVTAVAALESGKFSPYSTLWTSDYITVGGIRFHEHSGGYGAIGFRDAFAFSSNTFFYQVGMSTGPEQISHWASRLGIGTTDLQLLGLQGGSPGSVPTPDRKEEIYGEPWYLGDTVSMSIGQGLVLASPLELAVMVASIANGGWRVKPHLLTAQTHTTATQPEPTGMARETLATIRSGLMAVVEYGTGRRLNDGSIPPTAGKTGTAEMVGQADHAVFVAYGPVSDPEIAIAVVVENGGYGSVGALPIAQKIFQAYFSKHAAQI